MTAAPVTHVALDRHALVATVWLAAGLVAAALFHYGLARGGTPFLLAAFGVVLAAFAGHVVVNVATATTFSTRELALGLVVYATALVAFGVGTLARPELGAKVFLPVGAGFVAMFVAVLFYLVTTTGLRGAFDSFDVVRNFRANPEGGAE